MFNGILITKEESGYRAAVAQMDEAQLPAGDVSVRVSHSTLNNWSRSTARSGFRRHAPTSSTQGIATAFVPDSSPRGRTSRSRPRLKSSSMNAAWCACPTSSLTPAASSAVPGSTGAPAGGGLRGDRGTGTRQHGRSAATQPQRRCHTAPGRDRVRRTAGTRGDGDTPLVAVLTAMKEPPERAASGGRIP